MIARPVRKLIGLGKIVLVAWAAYHIGHACGRRSYGQTPPEQKFEQRIELLYQRDIEETYQANTDD